jgi:hypothetical protein
VNGFDDQQSPNRAYDADKDPNWSL